MSNITRIENLKTDTLDKVIELVVYKLNLLNHVSDVCITHRKSYINIDINFPTNNDKLENFFNGKYHQTFQEQEKTQYSVDVTFYELMKDLIKLIELTLIKVKNTLSIKVTSNYSVSTFFKESQFECFLYDVNSAKKL